MCDCGNCGNGPTLTNGTGDQGPQGPQGETGNGIDNIAWSSNDAEQPQSTQGTTDTYLITFTDGSTSTFTIYNGANGTNGSNGSNGSNGTNGIDAAIYIAKYIPQIDLITGTATTGGMTAIPSNGNYVFFTEFNIDSDNDTLTFDFGIKKNGTFLAGSQKFIKIIANQKLTICSQAVASSALTTDAFTFYLNVTLAGTLAKVYSGTITAIKTS